MATRDELVAARRSEDEVAAFIGADWLVYQDLADLEASVRELNPALASFDSSCFNGVYCTGAVSEDYLSALSAERSDSVMAIKNQGEAAAVAVVEAVKSGASTPRSLRSLSVDTATVSPSPTLSSLQELIFSLTLSGQ